MTIRFITCKLGDHAFVSTEPKVEITLDGETVWACMKCYRRAEERAFYLTEIVEVDDHVEG